MDDVAVVMRVSAGTFEKVTVFLGSDFAAPEAGSAGPDAGFGMVVGIATEEDAGSARDAIDHGRDSTPVLERCGGECVAEHRSLAGRRAVAGHVGNIERAGGLKSAAPGLFEMDERAGSSVDGFTASRLELTTAREDIGDMIEGKVERCSAR